MYEVRLTWIRLSFVLFFVFLFSSCDKITDKDDDKTNVVSGIAQTQQIVFSKSCAEGSFQVSRIGPATTTTTVGLASLQAGEKIRVSGKVSNNSCGGGILSFTCDGTVAIETRSFVCNSGSVSAGIVTTRPTVNTLTTRSFIKGEFHVLQNGTESSASITMSGSHGLICMAGFICRP